MAPPETFVSVRYDTATAALVAIRDAAFLCGPGGEREALLAIRRLAAEALREAKAAKEAACPTTPTS